MDFRTISFVAIAGLLYGLLHQYYTHGIDDEVLRKSLYPTVIGQPAVKVINTMTPERRAKSSDNKISSRKAVLNIVRGCDGSGVWFMLLAAVFAFGITQNNSIAASNARFRESSKNLANVPRAIMAFFYANVARSLEVIIGLLLGTIVVYLVNQIRIVGLFYLVEWDRTLFPVVHTYFAPTLIILIIAGFFLWWTQWAMQRWQQKEVIET